MSELRRDFVSGDWIILAPERAARPRISREKQLRRNVAPKAGCPFEERNLESIGMWPPIVRLPATGQWRVAVVRNRFPALSHADGCATTFVRGPHQVKTGVGEHDLIITRSHRRNFAHLSLREAGEVFDIMQQRVRMVARDPCNAYTSIFFNWGLEAGASVYHPHFQVLTLPIVPPRVAHSLAASQAYFRKHRRCIHCVMLAYDEKEKKRIVAANAHAIAVAPFISKAAFEVRVFPREHAPRFDNAPRAVRASVAALVRETMSRMERKLGDPDLNFFIHTAPLRGNAHRDYHWHVEIVPKVSPLGGFELSTGVDINVVDPVRAVAVLRGKQKYA